MGKPAPLTAPAAMGRLAEAASDPLFRWLTRTGNEDRVRSVLAAALTRAHDSHMLQRMQTASPTGTPARPSALSRLPVASGLLLAWLKARSKGLKGAFDPDLLASAAPYLPGGWQITPATGLLPTTGTNYDALRRLQEYAGIRRGEAMQSYTDDAEWAISPEAADRLPIVVVPEADIDRKKGRVIVEHPVPGTLYVSAPPRPGQWGQGPMILWVRTPSIGVRAWAVRAPSGKAMLVLDKPRGRGEPLTADAFWKWAYAEGLAEAARAALPTEAQERAAKRAEAVAKGEGTCGVCFSTHSLHTRSNVLVQHGYQMVGGDGHGHYGMQKAGADCFGVGWQPFEKSAAATQAWSEECARRSASLAESARKWEAGEHDRMWLLHTKPLNGWARASVQECSQYTLPESNRDKSQRVEQIGPGHPEWAPRVASKVREMRAQSAVYAASSKWYTDAAKAWPAYPEGR